MTTWITTRPGQRAATGETPDGDHVLIMGDLFPTAGERVRVPAEIGGGEAVIVWTSHEGACPLCASPARFASTERQTAPGRALGVYACGSHGFVWVDAPAAEGSP